MISQTFFTFLSGMVLLVNIRLTDAVLPEFQDTVPKTKCDPPQTHNPILNIKFKDFNNMTYPRNEMRILLRLDKDLQTKVRLHVRLKNIQNRLNIDQDFIQHTKPSPWLRQLCTATMQKSTIGRFVNDPDNGDCWVLKPWWGVQFTWVNCDRVCSNVQSSIPFFIYTCTQGNYKEETFWTFCPKTKKFVFRKLLLPKCCLCEKLLCMFKPIPIHTVE